MGVTMHADLVVFGPHPDDIEIGIGGSVATHVDLGYTVGLCDLTRGELGSNGTPEERVQEAQAALACYVSQFRPPGEDAVETRLTGGPFLHMIEARDAHLGTQIGAAQAEGFVVRDPLVRPTLLKS